MTTDTTKAANDCPWDFNEHGAWCVNCGNLIAPSFWEGWEAKAEEAWRCTECGFPDFEDGFE